MLLVKGVSQNNQRYLTMPTKKDTNHTAKYANQMGWVNAKWIYIHVGSGQVRVIGMADSESFQSLCK